MSTGNWVEALLPVKHFKKCVTLASYIHTFLKRYLCEYSIKYDSFVFKEMLNNITIYMKTIEHEINMIDTSKM